jgi:hypothetical protein
MGRCSVIKRSLGIPCSGTNAWRTKPDCCDYTTAGGFWIITASEF